VCVWALIRNSSQKIGKDDQPLLTSPLEVAIVIFLSIQEFTVSDRKTLPFFK